MSARVSPMHCPYCGEEDLRPHAGELSTPDGRPVRDAWECRGCARVFAVRFLGLASTVLEVER